MLYKIGVTGNICSGKSSCIKFLSKLPHTYILNLDLIGHSIYERNMFFIEKIKENFYEDKNNIFKNEGSVHEKFIRKELGKIVFGNDKKLKLLDRLIRPELEILAELNIRKINDEVMKKNKKAILFIEGAILIEGGRYQKMLDEIWMTVASDEEVKKRFNKRNSKMDSVESEQLLNKILKHQMISSEKAKYCNEVIDTSKDFDETKEIYITLYNKVLNEKLKL
jgi:dephospho-CoA kinase